MLISDGASIERTKHWWTDPNFDRHKDYVRAKREAARRRFAEEAMLRIVPNKLANDCFCLACLTAVTFFCALALRWLHLFREFWKWFDEHSLLVNCIRASNKAVMFARIHPSSEEHSVIPSNWKFIHLLIVFRFVENNIKSSQIGGGKMVSVTMPWPKVRTSDGNSLSFDQSRPP